MNRVLVAALMSLSVSLLAPGDWPDYRGPDRAGVSTETGWATTFPATGPKQLWSVAVGNGYSAPAVVGDRVFVMGTPGRRNDSETIYCLGVADGKTLWKHRYDLAVRRNRSPIASSPVVVDGRVYVYGAGADLLCLDAGDGDVLWHRPLRKDIPALAIAYGYCATPLVTGGKVIVPVFPQTAKSRNRDPGREPGGGGYPLSGGMFVAFSAADGKELWRNTDGASAWASPILARPEGKPTVVHATGQQLVGIDPADGKTRWTFDAVKHTDHHLGSHSATPAASGDRIVFFNKGRKISAACVEIRDGKPKLIWSGRRQNWFHSPVIHDGRIYLPQGGGTLTCCDLKTGERLWFAREMGRPEAPPAGGRRRRRGIGGGAFIVADGKILLVNAYGHLVVAEPTRSGCKVLAHAPVLDADRSQYRYQTTPVLCDGRIYCRSTVGQLVCLDVRGKGK